MFMRYATVLFSIAVTAAACGSLSSSPQETEPEALGTAAAATTPCGALRDVCCANDVCNAGLVCDSGGGLCRVGVDCGSSGEACCAAGRCEADLNCVSDVCRACGATGQACCGLGTDTPCESGDTCSGGSCVACGAAGEACCSSGPACGSNLNCTSGTCDACGGIDEPCCTAAGLPNNGCAAALECSGGECIRTCPGPCCSGGCGP
jgi:hypothetical protein